MPSPKDESLLDNPIWAALTTRHAAMALGADLGHGLARRYPSNIGPLAAFEHPTPDAYADLAALVPDQDVAVLFLPHPPEPPPGWHLLRGDTLVQMLCATLPAQVSVSHPIVPLGPEHYPAMLTLATLTEPGPFRDQTATLGNFHGIFIDGQLAAMAGQRLSPTGFAEVSAVCTHPDHRGHGFARALVAEVARRIHADGRTPFLTSLQANAGAVHVYQQVGFVIRRTFELAVLKPPAKPVP